LAMIAAAATLYSDATTFPGAAALLPTLGAALLLNAGHGGAQTSGAFRLLSTRPLVFVGKISYSLYLVHWPLIVLVEYRQDARLDLVQATIIIGLSIALAALSWRFIEQPFRRPGHEALPRTRLFGRAAAATALCCALGGGLVAANGWPGRLSPEVRAVYAMIRPEWKAEDACFVDTKGRTGPSLEDIRAGRLCSMSRTAVNERPKFLVWGDSHAPALAPGIFKAGDKLGLPGVLVGAGSCPPLEDFETLTARPETRRRCHEVNEAAFDFLQRERVPLVFLVARWARAASGNGFGEEGMFFDPAKVPPPVPGEDARFAAALDRTLARLMSYGVHPVVVLDVPEAGYAVAYATAKAMMAGRDLSKITLTRRAELERDGHATDIIEQIAAKYNAPTVEPDPFFCNDDVCDLVRGGVPLYRDSDHITRTTALQLSDIFDSAFASFVKASN
ncbi:acyltransferase family protein, partial [Hansschlegelia beijingensis]